MAEQLVILHLTVFAGYLYRYKNSAFKNNKAYIQAGGGVVADSVPENEYQESCNKAMAVINAIKEASKL